MMTRAEKLFWCFLLTFVAGLVCGHMFFSKVPSIGIEYSLIQTTNDGYIISAINYRYNTNSIIVTNKTVLVK